MAAAEKICKHATRIDPAKPKIIRCALGLYGGEPHIGVCTDCPNYNGPCRGVGDMVHKVTTLTGVATVVKAVEKVMQKP